MQVVSGRIIEERRQARLSPDGASCALSLSVSFAGNRIRQLPDLTALSCLVELNLRRNAISALTDGNHSFITVAALLLCMSWAGYVGA